MRRILFVSAVLLMIVVSAAVHGQDLNFADLGDFPLESGRVIRDCKLGYRTFGTLNEDKSNAILIPTWFTGKTQDFIDRSVIGAGRIFDDTHYYLIAVDAFGNGVSSSPSNSKKQPGDTFPGFTITDMVNAQHKLLTEKLNLTHLYAVMGISMGGMQTFQWMVSYPDFMDKAIPVAGTPQLTAYDMLLWTTELSIIEAMHGKPQTEKQAMKIVAGIHTLALSTPTSVNSQTKPEDFSNILNDLEEKSGLFDARDYAWQLKAMLDHNIAGSYGGSLEKIVSIIKAQPLVIFTKQDLMVNPEPVREFAGLMNAEILEISSDCGHMGVICEAERVGVAIARFLKK